MSRKIASETWALLHSSLVTELENQISVLTSQTSILLSCYGSLQQTAHKGGFPSIEPVLGKALRTGLLCCVSESSF